MRSATTSAPARPLERLASLPPAFAGGPPEACTVAWVERDGTRWWGGGCAVRFEARDRDEALLLPDRCQGWLREHGLAGLRCFGGLAFDGDAPGAFPAGAFWLPAWTVCQGRDGVACHGVLPELLPAGPWRPGAPRGDLDGADWQGRVAEALAAIAAGELDKVVLAHAEALVFEAAPSLGPVFEHLVATAPGTFRFLLRPAEGLAFMGASPELLLACDGARWEADCLAGTAARGADAAKDARLAEALAANAKERHEHRLVVDAVAEALGQGALALEVPAAPHIRQLANVQHLATIIKARHAPDRPLAEALAALFPTPAVCGLPRAAARTRIATSEGAPRGWYAGAVGWVGAHDACLAVGIRAASIAGREAWVHAGAGIVAGSQPAAEWAETRRKAAPLRALLTQEAPR